MEISKRKTAIQLGLHCYYTGKPCKHGHLCERRTDGGNCVQCLTVYQVLEKSKQSRRNYKKSEAGKLAAKKYNKSIKGKVCAKRHAQSEKGKKSTKNYQDSSKGKEAARKYQNSPKGKEVFKRYRQSPAGKLADHRVKQTRRARKLGAECVPYSENEKLLRFYLFNNSCAYCLASEKLSEDHFIPLSKGGPHRIENIIPACVVCNSSKHSRNPKTWYESQPFYSERRWNKIIKHTLSVRLPTERQV